MSQESFGKRYYDPLTTSANYIDIMSGIQTCIWDYVAKIFFGGDLRRVVYSDATSAFRSRLIQLGEGIDDEVQPKDTQLYLMDARFPFASFSLTSSPEIVKTRSSSLMEGYYDTNFNQYIHFYGMEQKAKVQVYFDNIADAELGYRLALQESHSGAAMNYQDEYYWRGKVLGIPILITIEKVTAGQDSFKNSEFLKSNGLFPVVLNLNIETAEPHFNKGINLIQLPYKWRITGRPDDWKDGDKIYFTRKAVLQFSHYYENVKLMPEKVKEEVLEDNAEAFYQMTELDKETIQQVSSMFPNPRLCEMIKGTFSNASKIKFSKLKYNEEKTTVDEETGLVDVWIDLRIHPNSYDFWNKCKIIVPAHPDGKLKTCKDTNAVIEGLYPNSHYIVYFVTEDINGNSETIPLEFTTPKWSKETLAEMDGTIESINDRINDEPKDVPLNGLIDLDDEWTGFEM